LGKTITIENGYGKDNFKVMGVIDESLGKTQIKARMFLNLNSGGMGSYVATSQGWAGNNFCYSYVKLRPGTNATALEKKFPAFLNKYGGGQMRAGGGGKKKEDR